MRKYPKALLLFVPFLAFPSIAGAAEWRVGEISASPGFVTDFFGKRSHEVRATFAGQVLYLVGTPPVSAGEPLAFVGAQKSGGN